MSPIIKTTRINIQKEILSIYRKNIKANIISNYGPTTCLPTAMIGFNYILRKGCKIKKLQEKVNVFMYMIDTDVF